MLDLKEFEYILSIAKHQNISRAAKELYISQPSLSKYLQNIEFFLGIKLFNKFGNKFVLTFAGERYCEYAREMLYRKKELEKEMKDIEKNNTGRINIGIPFTRGSYVIPATIPPFFTKYPNVEINIIEDTSENLEKKILEDEIDVAFFNILENNPNLIYKEIGEEEVVLAISKNNPLCKKAIKNENSKFLWIDLKYLKNERFILNFSFQRTGLIAEEILKNSNFRPKEIFRVRSIDGAIRLASNDFGVCFATENHLKHLEVFKDEALPAYFSVGTPPYVMKFVAAFKKGSYIPQYTLEYIEILREFLSK